MWVKTVQPSWKSKKRYIRTVEHEDDDESEKLLGLIHKKKNLSDSFLK